jgi:hypothetical protein
MIKKSHIVFPIFILMSSTFFLTNCGNEKKSKVDESIIESIDPKIELLRFDQDLFNAANSEEVLALEKKYPDFYPVYMYQIMAGITGMADVKAEEAASNIIKNFTTVTDFGIWLKNRADTVFPTLDPFKKDLTNAMKHYRYHFPKDTIPRFITFLSPLVVNFPVVEGKNQIGIGLDMYLGNDFKVYHSYNLADQFPNYRIRKMRKEYMLRDLLTAMSEKKIKTAMSSKRLIDEMIHEGKILYMVDALIPETDDSIKMGYTSEQMEWAEENESQIWAALVDSKALYTTEPDEIRDYISDGPFTTAKGFGAGTAPRTGAYIGWQIIKKYMELNPEMSIEKMLLLNDSDLIMTKARYKP